MNADQKKIVAQSMFDTLKIYEGDASLVEEDGDLNAMIPYYAHGRMNEHIVPLSDMVDAAYSGLIIAGVITHT